MYNRPFTSTYTYCPDDEDRMYHRVEAEGIVVQSKTIWQAKKELRAALGIRNI